MKVIAQQNDTLDLICYRVFGKTKGILERVLELNQNMTRLGEIIPIGTEVNLPERVTEVQEKTMINLWD